MTVLSSVCPDGKLALDVVTSGSGGRGRSTIAFVTSMNTGAVMSTIATITASRTRPVSTAARTSATPITSRICHPPRNEHSSQNTVGTSSPRTAAVTDSSIANSPRRMTNTVRTTKASAHTIPTHSHGSRREVRSAAGTSGINADHETGRPADASRLSFARPLLMTRCSHIEREPRGEGGIRGNGAPGRNRTCDQPLRRRSLYPLSYGGAVTCSVSGEAAWPTSGGDGTRS